MLAFSFIYRFLSSLAPPAWSCALLKGKEYVAYIPQESWSVLYKLLMLDKISSIIHAWTTIQIVFPCRKNVRLEDLVLISPWKESVSSCIIAAYEEDWWNRQVACFDITSFINSDELGINTESKGIFCKLNLQNCLKSILKMDFHWRESSQFRNSRRTLNRVVDRGCFWDTLC